MARSGTKQSLLAATAPYRMSAIDPVLFGSGHSPRSLPPLGDSRKHLLLQEQISSDKMCADMPTDCPEKTVDWRADHSGACRK
jgi:hypothetical protein